MLHIIADHSMTCSPAPDWPLVTPTLLFRNGLLEVLRGTPEFKDREISVLRDAENFRRWDFVGRECARPAQWLERVKDHEVMYRCASYQDVPVIDTATKEVLAYLRCRRAAVFVLKKGDPCHQQ